MSIHPREAGPPPDDRTRGFIARALVAALVAGEAAERGDGRSPQSGSDRTSSRATPVDFSLAHDSAARLLDQASLEPLRAALVARSLNALASVTANLPAASLARVVSAPSDYDVLLEALQAALSVPPDAEQREEERLLQQARARGVMSRRHILNAEGGTLSSPLVAEHLGISRQAVDDRRKKGRLLGLRTGSRTYAYPAWQLSQEGTLAGLEDVLTALSRWDPWTQAAFMLNPNTRLQGSSPLAEVRAGNVDAVVRAAQAYGDHSA